MAEQPAQLSALDASFLYLERPTEPFHVGAIAILERAPDFDTFVATLGQRLGALPRYRQVPVRPLLDLDLPVWREDPEFDPRRHVHRATVPPPGDDAALHRLLDELFMRPFADGHPLWDCWLVEGLGGGRAALLNRVHHCMIDGVSGAQVLEVMTESPGPTDNGHAASPTANVVAMRPHANQEPTRSWLSSALDAALHPIRTAAAARDTVTAAGVVAGLALERIEPLPFNGPITGARRIVWSSFDLERFLAIRGVAGCKVNDVVLAVIAGALHHFLPESAIATGRRARALIPVSIRRADERLALGNRVSGMVASLPLDVADPLERLRLVASDLRSLKESGQSRAFDLALAVIGGVPTPLAPIVGRLPAQRPLVHTVCTNVPGPREARFMLGHQVLEIHPIVPLAFGIGLGFAILSYAGKLSIVATADPTLVPDVDRLPDALAAAADELATCLGVGAPPTGRELEHPQATTVSDLMTREVMTIGPHELLRNAWDTMHARRIRHLPVVDRHGRLLGLVTHRDLLGAAASTLRYGENDRKTLFGWAEAADVMETHLSTAAASESASDAGLRMVRHKIGCLPVVEGDGKLVGIVTEDDYVRWAVAHMATDQRR